MNCRSVFRRPRGCLLIVLMLAACSPAPARPALDAPATAAPQVPTILATPTGDAGAAVTPIIAAPVATPTPDPRILATLPVGHGPTSPAVDGATLWVPNASDNTVTHLDLTATKVLATIRLGEPPSDNYGSPHNVVVAQGAVWLPDSTDHRIVQINPHTNQISMTIPLDVEPYMIAVDERTIWVTSLLSGVVVRIDANTQQVLARLDAGTASEIVISDGSVWVTSLRDNLLIRIDPRTNQIVARIALGHGPSVLCGFCVQAMVARGGALWLVLGTNVARIDPRTNRIVATIPFTNQSSDGGLVLSGMADAVWVATYAGKLVRIDAATSQVTDTLPLSLGFVTGITVSGQSTWLVVPERSAVIKVATTLVGSRG